MPTSQSTGSQYTHTCNNLTHRQTLYPWEAKPAWWCPTWRIKGHMHNHTVFDYLSLGITTIGQTGQWEKQWGITPHMRSTKHIHDQHWVVLDTHLLAWNTSRQGFPYHSNPSITIHPQPYIYSLRIMNNKGPTNGVDTCMHHVIYGSIKPVPDLFGMYG